MLNFYGSKTWAKSNFWFYTLKVPKERRKGLMDFLLSNNIQVRPVWKLIHTLPMYKDSQTYEINNSFELYESCMNLPCSVNIVKKDIEYITETIRRYFKKA